MNTSELQSLFFKEIPITKSMGLTVISVSTEKIEIGFNLAENRNHKGTAFGGSQYTACALACYGLFLVGIRDKGHQTNNIVIADGRIKYKSPVNENFIVKAEWNLKLRTHFFKTLAQKKKAKVQLSATIFAGADPCAEFEGDFVAVLELLTKGP